MTRFANPCRLHAGNITRSLDTRIEKPCQFRYSVFVAEDPRIGFIVGFGGWTKVSWPGGQGYIRFAVNSDNKTWRIVELRMPDPTTEALRSLPLSRIEAAANAHGPVVLGLAVGRNGKPPADVESMFGGKQPEKLSRLRLERPKGKRLGDDFYKKVAIAYRGALAEGLNPRQALMQDTGAKPDSVARWVGEARRRGYLPPAQPGKATALAEPEKVVR